VGPGKMTSARGGTTAIGEGADGTAMFENFIKHRSRLAAMMLIAAMPMLAATAQAQHVIVVVNGEPITALDVDQRSKLNQLSSQKAPTRQEVIEELINEKLKVREARRFGLEVTEADVESTLASMASRMRMNTEMLTQHLAKSGVNIATLKHRIRADIAWPQIVRGRYSTSLQVAEKDILTAMPEKTEDTAGYDYTLRPILFLVTPGSSESAIEGRKREAENLRSRFQSCDSGIATARSLKDVAVRDQIVRSSADIPAPLRKVLDGIEIGRLSAPEVTKLGIEMYAVCAKKESAADNSPTKRKVRESLIAERFEQRSKQYLKEIRRSSMIEYK
jgi:peptidyl-prolyl cis-trans isomerase SurA